MYVISCKVALLLVTQSLLKDPASQIQTLQPSHQSNYSTTGRIAPGKRCSAEAHSHPLVLPHAAGLGFMGTRSDFDPAADHALFNPQEAFVRVVTAANHLILSQHMHFHGKKCISLNVFLLIKCISLNNHSSECLHWQMGVLCPFTSMRRAASRKILLPASQWKQSMRSQVLSSCWRKERRAYNDMSKCVKPLCCQQLLCLGSQVSSQVYTLAVS